jgi:opacity protein-like surface antigen
MVLGVALLGVAARSAAAQQVTVGPQFALGDYREVTSGLRFLGTGGGGTIWGHYHRLSAEASVLRLQFHPASGSTASLGFTATQVDAWLAYDVASYVSLEAGVTRRTADPAFSAQSVGAVRAGARAFYGIGPGATLVFRVNYLAAPSFSGGGRGSVALDLGLGLDVQLVGHVHGTAAYSFQRINRKTNPGGTGEVDAPIQQALARLGLAVAL